MSNSSGRHSVPRQVMVNLFVQAAMEVGIPGLEKLNPDLYKKMGWLAQNKGTQLQVAIGGAASAAEVMFDAMPFLKEDVKGVIDEGLESLGSSIVKYFKGKDLGLPKDYKVEGDLGGLVTELFKTLSDVFKGSTEKVRQLFSLKLPSREAKERDGALTHLAALSERDTTKSKTLVRRWLNAMADLPKEQQDDLRRIDKNLCVDGVIEGLLKMSKKRRAVAIEKMAKNTLEEELGELTSIAAKFVRPTVRGLKGWLKKRAKKHADARAAATTPPAQPTVTP